MLSAIPNANVLLSPLTTREAVLSSRIEGTQTTFDEVLRYDAEAEEGQFEPDRMADIQEVINYRTALNSAVRCMEELPLSQRLVKGAHEILMQGVRGHGKAPGEYRQTPNWIGPANCDITEARFVPITADKLQDGMNDWEAYIHSDVSDRLIQLSVLHAEFEAIHPFLDGNGRIGRMFVPLFMVSFGLIQAPLFYVSAYLEANRDEYYDRLLAVSRNGAWTDWIEFFVRAIQAQAAANIDRASAILSLHQEMRNHFVELTRSQFAVQALDWIFERPIFRSSDFVHTSGIPDPSARRILAELRDNGVLKTVTESSGRRSATYAFAKLLNAAEGAQVF
jgi:Fic family protein